MKWQYYPKWRLGLTKTVTEYQDYAWYDYVFCLGPFQFNWKGKPWCNHLRRSPEYTEGVKRLLLEDLKTIKYNNGDYPCTSTRMATRR